MADSIAERVKSRKREHIPIATRREILERQHRRCASCKERLEVTYEVDHIIPHSYGGSDFMNNLHALCPNCHARKTREEPSIKKFIEEMKKVEPTYELCWRCKDIYSSFFRHRCSGECWFSEKKHLE